MKGYRTIALQKYLNLHGAHLTVDGEYGTSTESEVKSWQAAHRLTASGQADPKTLELMGLTVSSGITGEADNNSIFSETTYQEIRVIGDTVNIRIGPGISYPSIKIAKRDEVFQAIDTSEWQPILVRDELRWISKKYIESIT